MGKNDVCINTIGTRMKLAIYERNFLLLFWVEKLFVVGFDFRTFLIGTPGGCTIAVVLTGLFVGRFGYGFRRFRRGVFVI